MNYSATNHCTDVIIICSVTSILVSITLDAVTWFFSHKKTQEIHVNASITVKVLGGISFHVPVKNWKHLKHTLAFLKFLVSRILV